jgi:hypothetical protein
MPGIRPALVHQSRFLSDGGGSAKRIEEVDHHHRKNERDERQLHRAADVSMKRRREAGRFDSRRPLLDQREPAVEIVPSEGEQRRQQDADDQRAGDFPRKPAPR